MKIRTGFVSNSSSSSFVVYGVHCREFNKFIDLIKERMTDEKDRILFEETCMNDITQFFYEMDAFAYDTENHVVGISPLTMSDNQTMGEFKKETKQRILKFLNIEDKSDEIDFDFFDYVIYN